MKITKLVIALALFMTSMTYEKQVLMTTNGIDSHWNVSISITNEAFAAQFLQNNLTKIQNLL